MDGMNWGYLIALTVALFAGKYIVDWYHQISRRNRLMIANMKLLAILAVNAGGNKEEVAQVLEDADANSESVDYKIKSLRGEPDKRMAEDIK